MVLKVKKGHGLYIKIRSSENESTVMSIKGIFSASKMKVGGAKPGDKGLLQYQLLSSTKAEISFEDVACNEEKNCRKDFSYTSLSSDSIESIYSQLVCPSIMFNLASLKQHKPATLASIIPNPSNSKIIFIQ